MEDKLLNCKNENEVKQLAVDILGDGEWEKLASEVLTSYFFKNWKNGKGVDGVAADLEQSNSQTAYDASILATIYSKFWEAHL